MAKPEPKLYACAGCGVVVLPAPGLCPACAKFFNQPKPGKGK
jgi:hypothetical protein